MTPIGDVWLSPPMLGRLCALTGAHRTTAARWLKARQLPRAVHELLEISWHGKIERIHHAWAGWSIDPRTGDLVTPAGWTFGPGEIIAMPLRYQHIAALQCELRELKKDAQTRPGNRWPLRAGQQHTARANAARRRLDRRPAPQRD